jgi:DNA-directed RNA polymerase subunit RPC12/RpoP
MAKVYVCRECSYVFPEELSHLIESNIQVYCERCGSPFILEGIKFKPAPTPYIREKKPYFTLQTRKSSSLNNFIQFLNKISFIPLFIFTCVSFGLIAEIALFNSNWVTILIERLFQSSIALFLLTYDRTYIVHKVREKKYNEIFLDSICWGILGCIMYGIGVIILIKGIFILIYVLTDPQNKEFKKLNYGLLAKNSLNYFSTKAGLIIILLGLYKGYSDRIYLPHSSSIIINMPFNIQIPLGLLIYIGILIIALAVLLIDSRIKKEIKEKQKFASHDSVKFIEDPFIPTLEEKEIELKLVEEPIEGKGPEIPEREEIKTELKKIEEIAEKELESIPFKLDKEEKIRREEEFELRLHDSLLPVKDEKDKKLVKEYFSKIFAVLSKDLRMQIMNLKISKKEKRELLEELVFLTKEEQVKYIEAIVSLYKEIPKRLINRIRKLPNVKPRHYDKIVDQLKYMDFEEQIKFVQFLEDNA